MVAEVALTLVLLVEAGLLLRSFHSLQQVDAGFTPARVLSFRLELPWRKYATEEQQLAFYQSLEEKLRALPGVQGVGFGSQFPLGGGGWQPKFTIEGQPALPPHERPSMEVMVASPDYFRALGIRLLRGRYFTGEDLTATEKPASSFVRHGSGVISLLVLVLVWAKAGTRVLVIVSRLLFFTVEQNHRLYSPVELPASPGTIGTAISCSLNA